MDRRVVPAATWRNLLIMLAAATLSTMTLGAAAQAAGARRKRV